MIYTISPSNLTVTLVIASSIFAQSTQKQHHISQPQLNTIINDYASTARKSNSEKAIAQLIKNHKHIFTNELSDLLCRYTDNNRKENLLEFDPILNTQDPAENYKVGNIKRIKTTYFSDIFAIDAHNTKTTPVATIELKFINKSMLIINIHYNNGSNLIKTAERQGLTIPSTTPASPARTQPLRGWSGYVGR